MDRSERPFAVDLTPAERVGDADLRAWAREQHVFVSSVMTGMTGERKAVAEAVERIGANPVWFERFGGRDDDPEQAYLTEVAKCDIYVGILGERYGRMLPTGYSATHAEYGEAVRRGLRTSVWVLDGELAGHQRDFVDEVRAFRTTGTYTTPDDLERGVEDRLRVLAAEALSPWVKIGNAVFRARRIIFDGRVLKVDARVRDDHVVATLEALRPGGFWRGPTEARATWSGRSEHVAIKSVESETAPGRGSRISIVAERTEPPSGRSALVDVAVSGRSPEDLGEVAIRVALFAEPNPLGATGFMLRMANPFPVIEAMHLPEDAVEPVAHLLLTEELVGGGRAERITSLQVGPRYSDSRQVALAWLPARWFSNSSPAERRVEGRVKLSGSASIR